MDDGVTIVGVNVAVRKTAGENAGAADHFA